MSAGQSSIFKYFFQRKNETKCAQRKCRNAIHKGNENKRNQKEMRIKEKQYEMQIKLENEYKKKKRTPRKKEKKSTPKTNCNYNKL
ncbi:hypothetical protein Glove_84g162 [Diversispora epigaea]|uniref:Uncharacterized protein n=1 Tax=Diversispora epigaea TaxID=1348612 RepID=A0A397J9U8_9GLOM|nr:hypothetical protein Glove_84g162 [Diversispora epigaea]